MFSKNRERLSTAKPGFMMVIAAHSLVQFSADIPYPFRQDSNFWYLCGINEPDLILLINTSSGHAKILLPEQNDYQVEWDGENKSGEFTKISGITHFGNIKDLRSELKAAKKKGLKVGYLAPLPEIVEPYGFYANPARRRVEAIIKEIEPEPTDIRTDIARLRQVKQRPEIALIQRAIDITAAGLEHVKKNLGSYETEKDIERALSAQFYIHGGDGHSFEPIIASGKNAATIHHKKNDGKIQSDSLLLLDVGAQSEGYAADISRVWSVGTPTKRQREVYDVLMDIQNYALDTVKPGLTIREFQEIVEEYAFKKQEQIHIEKNRYPHGISHFLGFDVHDAGDYDMPLADGMVLTVEPGIYLPEEGIGVRIEDDVLITNNSVTILSKNIPKQL